MFPVLAFGFLMMILAAVFWYLEIKPFWNNKYRVREYSKFPPFALFQGIGSLFINTYRLFYYGKYFIIDLGITMLSISMLGFGDAVTGGILGLAFSNVISALLTFLMWKEKRTKLKLAKT